MKPLLIILLCLTSCTSGGHHQGNTESGKSEPEYNIQKDEYVNKLLDTKPISTEVYVWPRINEVWYTLYYPDLKFGIKHFLGRDYSEKEHWEYGAVCKDGTTFILQSDYHISEHMISQKTYKRIQSICLNLKP